MWFTEIIVIWTKISWQTCQLFFSHVLLPPKHLINLFPHQLSAIKQTPFVLSYHLKIRSQLILYTSNLEISVRRSTQTIQPVFVSQKIVQDLKLQEAKPQVVNQQCLVYKFKCDLCDAVYVGFTHCHLHQCVQEHRNTETPLHRLIFVTSILWPQGILQRILLF